MMRQEHASVALTNWVRPCEGGHNMKRLLHNFWSDDEGQDLIEYALMLTLIILLSVAAIQGIGTKVSTVFTAVNDSLTT